MLLLQDDSSYTSTQSHCTGCCQVQHSTHVCEHTRSSHSSHSSTTCQRCLEPVLHDSATSHRALPADRLSNTVQTLNRLDTANVNETDGLLGTDCQKAQTQAGKAVAALPPHEARKTFLLGPPCAPCCPRRTQTAEGINALRHVSDVDIGDYLLCFLQILSVHNMVTSASV